MLWQSLLVVLISPSSVTEQQRRLVLAVGVVRWSSVIQQALHILHQSGFNCQRQRRLSAHGRPLLQAGPLSCRCHRHSTGQRTHSQSSFRTSNLAGEPVKPSLLAGWMSRVTSQVILEDCGDQLSSGRSLSGKFFFGGINLFSGSHYLDDDTSPVTSPEFTLMCPDASSSLVIFTYLLVWGERRLYFGSVCCRTAPPQVLDLIKT